ncbi:hypothetical protein GCM10010276_62470 [Streptomyces longisporus]|uniref:Uncharacterized protein n=1 Tax=Streptomyces longisporus TaxID=1948 RepID=A0ABP6A0Q6_STRLO
MPVARLGHRLRGVGAGGAGTDPVTYDVRKSVRLMLRCGGSVLAQLVLAPWCAAARCRPICPRCWDVEHARVQADGEELHGVLDGAQEASR